MTHPPIPCAIQLLERIQNLVHSLRNQNSGATIHTVGNLRANCILLICAIEEGWMSNEESYQMCLRLENRVSEFFIDKYSYLSTQGRVKPSEPDKE